MLAWIVANKEWLFGGIGVAVPLAIVGWWLQQRSSSASQSHPERKTGHAAAVIHGEKTAGKDEKKKERANNTIGGMPKQEWAFWTTRAPERIAFSYRMETVRWAIVVLLLLSGGTFALATFGLVPEGAKSFLTAGVKFSISGILLAALTGFLLSFGKSLVDVLGVALLLIGLIVLWWTEQVHLVWDTQQKDFVSLPWLLVAPIILGGTFTLLSRERFIAAIALWIFFILSLAPNF